MRSTRKTLVLAIALVAIITASMFGTVAYLIDTEDVTNTFTVGKVAIKLDEEIVDLNGDSTNEGRTDIGNKYHLIPGKEYIKDPTMTVMQNSEEAYYRMMVTINCVEALDKAFGTNILTEFFVGWDEAVWECVGGTDAGNDTRVYEFRYVGDPIDASNGDVKLQPLFEGLKVPGKFDNDDLVALKDLEIKIEGHAIQLYGFADADAAWAAFDDQVEGDATTGNGGAADNNGATDNGATDNTTPEEGGTGASDTGVKL